MAKLLKQSGTPIILEEVQGTELINMELVFTEAGALYAEPGAAKLASKLLSEGTRTLGADRYNTALENRAVSMHASVGAETFVMTLSAIKSEFKYGLEMLLQLLKDINYSDEAFDKIQNQTIGELTHRDSNYDYVATCNLKKIMFPKTPAEYPISGTVSSVKLVKKEALRSHIESKLGKENLIVAIAGAVDEEAAVEVTTKILDTLPSIEPREGMTLTVSDTPEKSMQHEEHVEQAYIYFGSGYNLRYDSTSMHMAKVAAFVLGSSGFGSRLMEEIRVKMGLAYSAYASVHFSRSSSYFTGHLQTKCDNTAKATDAVKQTIDRFVNSGITQEELDSAKQFMLGSEPLRFETMDQRLSIAVDEYYKGRELGYSKKELMLIESIKLADINHFIKEHDEIKRLSFAIVTNNQD